MAQKTLVIVYMATDNDLSPYADTIANRLRQGTRNNPDLAAIALIDRLGDANTGMYGFAKGKAWELDELKRGAELDMGDPATLGKFLRRARSFVKAERTVVSLIGHGTGPVPECDWQPTESNDATSSRRVSGFPVTPQMHPLTPQMHPLTGSLSSDRTLSTVGFGRAFNEATSHGKQPFDVVFFDQCFQGNLDVLFEMQHTATVFVASPNYAWLRAGYFRYLQAMATADSAETIASQLISIYQQTLDRRHPNAIFWVAGKAIKPIAAAADELANALLTALRHDDADATTRIQRAARMSQYVDTGRSLGQFELGRGDELIGLGSFAANLRLNFSARRRDGVHKAATKVLQTLLAVYSTHRIGRPHVAPEQVWGYSDSITVLAPGNRMATNEQAGVWRASLYKRQDKLVATWGPDSTQTVNIVQNLAYVHKGRWTDFIQAWYRQPLRPTLGQPLYINPRAFVQAHDAAELTLSAEKTNSTVALDWTLYPQQNRATFYTVFKKLAGHPWQELATVDNNVYEDAFAQESADYRVAVLDNEDVAHAVSNRVTA